MLKIVIFDGGYGGEFFADYLTKELPTIEIIRVIDWRNAEKILSNPKGARKVAEKALRPYLNKVSLIVFANHLLTITSLKYFRKKYKNQKFLGLELKKPDTFIKRDVLILTTKAVAKTLKYQFYVFLLRRNKRTIVLDSWPQKIDDGELTESEINDTLTVFTEKRNFAPKEAVLACSQFSDLKTELKNIFGQNLKIYDGYNDTLLKICKTLKIRGRLGKKPKHPRHP